MKLPVNYKISYEPDMLVIQKRSVEVVKNVKRFEIHKKTEAGNRNAMPIM